MYDVSAQGINEHMINVHYYYYYHHCYYVCAYMYAFWATQPVISDSGKKTIQLLVLIMINNGTVQAWFYISVHSFSLKQLCCQNILKATSCKDKLPIGHRHSTNMLKYYWLNSKHSILQSQTCQKTQTPDELNKGWKI